MDLVLCCGLSDLRTELKGLPPVGREALLLARTPLLTSACVRHAEELLVDLMRADTEALDRVNPAVLEHVVSSVPLEAVRSAVETLGGCPVYTFRYLLARLPVRDLLTRIAAVRDGLLAHTPYGGTLDGSVGLAFDLASGFDRFSRPRTPSRSTAETTLLLGAARDPQRLHREFRQVRIVQSALLNEDPGLLSWALGNPRLLAGARSYVVGLSSAPAILALYNEGVLDAADLTDWAAARQEDFDVAQLVSVFLLDGPVAARTALVAAVLAVAEDPVEILRALPETGRRRALEGLGRQPEPGLAETVNGLLGDWSGSLVELVEAAEQLVR